MLVLFIFGYFNIDIDFGGVLVVFDVLMMFVWGCESDIMLLKWGCDFVDVVDCMFVVFDDVMLFLYVEFLNVFVDIVCDVFD